MGIQSKRVALNPNLCTGCSICELVCSFTKFRVFNPRLSMIKIIYNYELGKVEGLSVCTQCGECVDRCPYGALKRSNGMIHLDYTICTGCLSCVQVCRYNAITVVDGKPYRCDLCSGEPQCIRYCVRGALHAA